MTDGIVTVQLRPGGPDPTIIHPKSLDEMCAYVTQMTDPEHRRILTAALLDYNTAVHRSVAIRTVDRRWIVITRVTETLAVYATYDEPYTGHRTPDATCCWYSFCDGRYLIRYCTPVAVTS